MKRVKAVESMIVGVGMVLNLIACQQVTTPRSMPTPVAEIGTSPTIVLPTTLPELMIMLNDPRDEARIGAARSIGMMGLAGAPAVPALIQLLAYKGISDVRAAAAWALGRIGPPAAAAVPQLSTVLLTDEAPASSAAADALGQIHDPAAIPALAQALYQRSNNVEVDAAQAIRRIAGVHFPGFVSGGYQLAPHGVPVPVVAARDWWEHIGHTMSWEHQAQPTP